MHFTRGCPGHRRMLFQKIAKIYSYFLTIFFYLPFARCLCNVVWKGANVQNEDKNKCWASEACCHFHNSSQINKQTKTSAHFEEVIKKREKKGVCIPANFSETGTGETGTLATLGPPWGPSRSPRSPRSRSPRSRSPRSPRSPAAVAAAVAAGYLGDLVKTNPAVVAWW